MIYKHSQLFRKALTPWLGSEAWVVKITETLRKCSLSTILLTYKIPEVQLSPRVWLKLQVDQYNPNEQLAEHSSSAKCLSHWDPWHGNYRSDSMLAVCLRPWNLLAYATADANLTLNKSASMAVYTRTINQRGRSVWKILYSLNSGTNDSSCH